MRVTRRRENYQKQPCVVAQKALLNVGIAQRALLLVDVEKETNEREEISLYGEFLFRLM